MLWNGLAKFRRKRREVGLAYTTFVLLKSILPARAIAFNSFHIRQRPYELLREPPAPELSFRPITEHDQAALGEFDEYTSDVAKELADGTLGFVLEKDGEIVASNWFTARDQKLFGWVVLRLPPDSVISVYITVPPRHRGNKYHSRMKERAADAFSRRGIARQISIVESSNRNSIHASNTSGSRTIARLSYLRLFDWKLVRYRGAWHAGRWTKDCPLVLEIQTP